MTTNITNAPIAPSAASTPQAIDHGDGATAAAIVPSTAVVAQTNHARRGRTGGGTPLDGGLTLTYARAASAEGCRSGTHPCHPRRSTSTSEGGVISRAGPPSGRGCAAT
jgi:hypothetical protein